MSKPGRPRHTDRRRPGNSTTEEILDAAAELFTTGGYTATTTRAIAESVGIRQASLYRHFPTKSTVLVELLVQTVAPSLEVARSIRENARNPVDGLVELVTFDVRLLAESRWNVGALYLLPEVLDEEYRTFREMRAELRRHYRELVAACLDGLNPNTPVADIPFGIVQSVIPLRHDRPECVIDPTAWARAALMAVGIRPRAERGREADLWT